MMLLTSKLSFSDLRKKSGLTQKDLAQRLEQRFGRSVTTNTVSAWETGKWKPNLSPDETQILCEELGCSFGELAEAFNSSGG